MGIESQANAKVVEDIQRRLIPLILLRYEQLFDLYSEEPYSVLVKERKNSKFKSYEQVFRVRKWIPNVSATAVYLYALDRESFGDSMIFRKVTWDRKKDDQKVREADKAQREELLNSWPTIRSESIFLKGAETKALAESLGQIDLLVKNGVTVHEKTASSPEKSYADMECSRRFNWGQVRSIWHPCMENQELEDQIAEFEKAGDAVRNVSRRVYQMSFDYLFNPENMFQSVCGINQE